VTLYPGASRAQWFGDEYPGVDMGGVDKVLLHTTETGSWPGYGGGASAPNLTYNPTTHEWRQHFHLERSARALRDPSGTAVRENRDRVCQVEIICSCDRSFADRYGYPHVTELDDQALRDLGAFVRFMHDTFGVPLRAADRWLPYPQSYGDSAVRMSGAEYDAFRGVLGHQHASGNSHGDPGSLNVTQIMAYATNGMEDDVSAQDVLDALASSAGQKAIREAVASTPLDMAWGDGEWNVRLGDALGMVRAAVLINREQSAEQAAQTVQRLGAVQTSLASIDLEGVDEAVAEKITQALDGLRLVVQSAADPAG
jgi:hypothetical protein